MNTFLSILLFIILGFVFGLLLAKITSAISNHLLKQKIDKDIKDNPKPFFYNKKPYDLKGEVIFEQSKHQDKGFFSGLFKKKVKGGISQYGESRDIASIRGEQISNNGDRVGTPTKPVIPTTTTTPTSETRGEQINSNPPETRGFGINVNGNLFKKGK